MAKKHVLIAVIIIVIAAVGSFIVTQKPIAESDTTNQPLKTEASLDQPNSVSTRGRYVTYSDIDRASNDYNRTILFFHAPWCPQCRAFDKNISTGNLPDGTQILKVDYDSNQTLRKQYGVTLQTTFVSVEPNGEQIKKWIGYTSNHTLAALLNEFGS